MATEKKGADAGQAEVQKVRDEARAKGYEGESPSTIPNERFSLATGPDSPSAGEQTVAGLRQQLADAEASLASGGDR